MGDTFVELVEVRGHGRRRAFEISRMLHDHGIGEVHVWPVGITLWSKLVPSRYQRHIVTVTHGDLPEARRLLTESGLAERR